MFSLQVPPRTDANVQTSVDAGTEPPSRRGVAEARGTTQDRAVQSSGTFTGWPETGASRHPARGVHGTMGWENQAALAGQDRSVGGGGDPGGAAGSEGHGHTSQGFPARSHGGFRLDWGGVVGRGRSHIALSPGGHVKGNKTTGSGAEPSSEEWSPQARGNERLMGSPRRNRPLSAADGAQGVFTPRVPRAVSSGGPSPMKAAAGIRGESHRPVMRQRPSMPEDLLEGRIEGVRGDSTGRLRRVGRPRSGEDLTRQAYAEYTLPPLHLCAHILQSPHGEGSSSTSSVL